MCLGPPPLWNALLRLYARRRPPPPQRAAFPGSRGGGWAGARNSQRDGSPAQWPLGSDDGRCTSVSLVALLRKRQLLSRRMVNVCSLLPQGAHLWGVKLHKRLPETVGCIAIPLRPTYSGRVCGLGLRACPGRRLYAARIARIVSFTHGRPAGRPHITSLLVRLHGGIQRGRPAAWTTAEDSNGGGGFVLDLSDPNPTTESRDFDTSPPHRISGCA
jgi:hypothetical protein